jgi:predicted nucleic-acid-binding protein
MIAVDTNVLVRILADDPGQPEQVEAARRLAGEAEKVFLSTVVQVETVWVLESGYGLRKEAVAKVLEHIEVNQAFVLEAPDLCQRPLALFRSCNVDYSDCLILCASRTVDLKLYTFDRRLGKLVGAALVPM